MFRMNFLVFLVFLFLKSSPLILFLRRITFLCLHIFFFFFLTPPSSLRTYLSSPSTPLFHFSGPVFLYFLRIPFISPFLIRFLQQQFQSPTPFPFKLYWKFQQSPTHLQPRTNLERKLNGEMCRRLFRMKNEKAIPELWWWGKVIPLAIIQWFVPSLKITQSACFPALLCLNARILLTNAVWIDARCKMHARKNQLCLMIWGMTSQALPVFDEHA